MTSIEKLKVLIPHWITHNEEHGKEFAKWAEQMKQEGNTQVADAILEAFSALQQVNEGLKKALNMTDGESEG